MNQTQYIDELNKIRGLEMRMSLVYHRLSQVITGPWRDALASQFEDHAAQETKHAGLVMRRIVALGGKVGVDVPEIPGWETLSEALAGIERLEREGIDSWNDLLDKLDKRDPFRSVVEDIIGDELEHLDEALRWRYGAIETESQDEVRTVGEDVSYPQQPEQDAGVDSEQNVDEPQEVSTSDVLDPVGDKRLLKVFGTGVNYLADDEIGDAWQQEDGSLTGTGLCYAMVFEPFAALMYRDSSIGLDVSPLSVLRMRLAHSPFLRVAWETNDE